MSKINKIIIKVFVVSFSVIFFVSCASIKTGTHYDHDYYFKGYTTFSWVSKEPIDHDRNRLKNVSPLTLKKIVDSIQSELEAKGYQYVEDSENADFSLAYSIGSREMFTIESYPVYYRNDWGWYWSGRLHHVDQWHVRNWTNGTLTIDIFDNKIKEPIWHGWATKAVSTKDRRDPSNSIKMSVSKIFNDFPILIK